MTSESWQVSNDAAMLYENYVYPLMDPWVKALVYKASLKKGETVLEVACGTGFASRLASKAVGETGHVIGTDLNKGMVAAAHKIADAKGMPSIEWREANVSNLPFDERAAEVVLCQQGMQFFPDTPEAVKELHRVLRPEGRFIFTIWQPISENPYLNALANTLESHLSAQVANGLRSAFTKTYAADFATSLLAVGFKDIEVESPILQFQLPPMEEYLPGHMASLPMAGAIAALPDNIRSAMIDDVSNSLKEYEQGGFLDIPSRSELIKAVKA